MFWLCFFLSREVNEELAASEISGRVGVGLMERVYFEQYWHWTWVLLGETPSSACSTEYQSLGIFLFPQFTRRCFGCLHAEGWKEGRKWVFVFHSGSCEQSGASLFSSITMTASGIWWICLLCLELDCSFPFPVICLSLSVSSLCSKLTTHSYTHTHRAGFKWDFISLILH